MKIVKNKLIERTSRTSNIRTKSFELVSPSRLGWWLVASLDKERVTQSSFINHNFTKNIFNLKWVGFAEHRTIRLQVKSIAKSVKLVATSRFGICEVYESVAVLAFIKLPQVTYHYLSNLSQPTLTKYPIPGPTGDLLPCYWSQQLDIFYWKPPNFSKQFGQTAKLNKSTCRQFHQLYMHAFFVRSISPTFWRKVHMCQNTEFGAKYPILFHQPIFGVNCVSCSANLMVFLC